MYKIDEKTLLDTLNYIGGSTSQAHNAFFSSSVINRLQKLEKIEEQGKAKTDK